MPTEGHHRHSRRVTEPPTRAMSLTELSALAEKLSQRANDLERSHQRLTDETKAIRAAVHRLEEALTIELPAVATNAQRALEAAATAQKSIDALAAEARTTLTAILNATHSYETSQAALLTENKAQSVKLIEQSSILAELKSDKEKRDLEKSLREEIDAEQRAIDERRWTGVNRWWPIVTFLLTAVAGLIAWLISLIHSLPKH